MSGGVGGVQRGSLAAPYPDQELGARSVALVTGGSLGGMVAPEWLAQNRGLARTAAVFAAPAAQTAAAIGWGHVQRRAVELAGEEGLALARQIAMLTYRTGAAGGRAAAGDGQQGADRGAGSGARPAGGGAQA
jgi:homoserine acetyltransferase